MAEEQLRDYVRSNIYDGVYDVSTGQTHQVAAGRTIGKQIFENPVTVTGRCRVRVVVAVAGGCETRGAEAAGRRGN